MKDEILTSKEVSKYLKLPLSTLHLLARSNEIPAFKIGRHWRFKKGKLEKWLEKQENVKLK